MRKNAIAVIHRSENVMKYIYDEILRLGFPVFHVNCVEITLAQDVG